MKGLGVLLAFGSVVWESVSLCVCVCAAFWRMVAVAVVGSVRCCSCSDLHYFHCPDA